MSDIVRNLHVSLNLSPAHRNLRFVGWVLLLTALHSAPAFAQQTLVITEIMYAPAAGKPEWVEVHNPGTTTVDIAGWMLKDATAALPVITAASRQVPAGGYLVIARDTSIRSQFPSVADRLCVMEKLPSLNNSGDDLFLFRPDSSASDSLHFTSSWGGGGGRSLERVSPLRSGNNAANWASCQSPGLATPGERNSVSALDDDVAVVNPQLEGTGIAVTVVNRGVREARDVELALFLDRNLDSAGAAEEELARVRARALHPDDSERILFPGVAAVPGVSRFLLQADFPADQRRSDNAVFLTVRNALPAGTLRINEIMYDPLEGDAEWIECINTGSTPLDVHGFLISDAPAVDGKRAYRTLTRVSAPVPAGGFLVIASDSTVLTRFPELASPSQGVALAFPGSGGLSLSNGGDEVLIADPGGHPLDSLRYAADWHNPNVITTKGRSLERLNPAFPSMLRANWTTCTEPRGGSPGRTNSVFTGLPSLADRRETALSFAPNPFSPDGDGVEDACVISWTLPWKSGQVRMRVFDTRGRMVRTITSAEPGGGNGRIPWDGRDDQGRRLAIGMYVVLLEASDERLVEAAVAKGVVVVASRL
jgi:hypothetical protein